jgi:hypothetical protein
MPRPSPKLCDCHNLSGIRVTVNYKRQFGHRSSLSDFSVASFYFSAFGSFLSSSCGNRASRLGLWSH